jgi:hypothetical protein
MPSIQTSSFSFRNQFRITLATPGGEVIGADDIWRDIETSRRLAPRFGIGIFEILRDVFERHFKFKPKYPVRVVVPRLPTQHSLFWASVFGEFPEDITARVAKSYSDPLDMETPEFTVDALSDLFKGNVLFPRRLTLHELQIRNRATFGRDASVFYMDASKTADIVDFWNLRATGRSVLPVPRHMQDHPQIVAVVSDFLRRSRRPWPHDPTACDRATIIRSRHTTMEDMEAWAKGLKLEVAPNDPCKDSFYLLQRWYPRIWDEWARDKDGAQPADAYGPEETIELPDITDRTIRFKPILPGFADEYGYSGEPRCANEISFRFYGETEFLAEVFPTTTGEHLSRAIGGLTFLRGDWRSGRHGLIKLVKDRISETREIPLGETIMFAWLQDLGWTPKLSTPGLLAQQIFRQLDGYPQYIMHDEKVLGLFEHMNGGQVKSDGSPVAENKIGQERDLPIGQVKNRVGAHLYDHLLAKGIFRLGVKVQCPRCTRHSWYALSELRDSLTCPRCLNAFPAVGHLDAATWSYKTAGPFSVPNYADGAYGVLSALTFFDDRKMHTMRMTSVLSFTAEAPDKRRIEADFASFWQESLYGDKSEGLMFGEAKTYSQFTAKDFERMRFLGKTFPGAVLVFSTLRNSLTPKEIAGLTRVAKAGRKYWKAERPVNPVLVLTGTELLAHHGPPYCWQEPFRTRFDRVTGLLQLCNATQQIYLGLAPWESEWHAKWEKRRLQRASKLHASGAA